MCTTIKSYIYYYAAADCEHRWSQLRERFTRERRLLKAGLPSGSGSSKQSTPSDLYKALQFLEPHIKSRRYVIY